MFGRRQKGNPNEGQILCDEVQGCVVETREPFAGIDMTPAERNVRVPITVYPQQSPDPIRYGDTPSREAKNQVVTFMAQAAIRAVQEDRFGVDLWAPVHVASTTPRFGLHTQAVGRWNERANIEKRRYEPYGSQYAVNAYGDSQLNADSEKLMLMGA